MASFPNLLSLGAALLAVLGGAAPSGLLASDAEARLAQAAVRRRDEEEETQELILAAPRLEARMLLAGHSSHRSHSSHSSHYSSSGSGSRYRSGGGYAAPSPTYVPPPAPKKPPPPKPAVVSFVAFPGGRIFIDDKAVGTDATGQLRLSAGTHKVRVENRYLGNTTVEVELAEGQIGAVRVDW